MDEILPDDLLAEKAKEDIEAFALLYRRHVHRVYSYLHSRVGHVQDAQDLTAQTFMAAMKSIASYQACNMFPAWLLGIAKHKSIDYLRNRQALTSIEAILPLTDGKPPIDEIVIERMRMEDVAITLEKLNPDRAEALRLRFFGELKFREIAEVMNKSEGAVKMLVSRALDDIRQLLAVQEERP
ncbi:sigma-70 family RNA polymerase sigma factor [Phototrophicus methaneseepsis]|uniref:Sigma-70 family RNA polymerase sigma factor n=1 Tax=Phototrophicus methaneseepsis TaxID=2710758 RepID=A0A7S8E5B9_9CHLR|nr:RNA polymerase sigma factor [Phototrophicus methaneseepsis]QPC80673.1 sigma-70 family RNA polymerase sigma factor [Phototrophicus methaneseepsis]